MIEFEVDSASVVIEHAVEAVVVQMIVGDANPGIFLDKANLNGTIVYRPVDVVGDIVPWGIAVVVDPIATATGISTGVFQESDLRIGGIVDATVVSGRDLHVALPSAFEGAGYSGIFTRCESERCDGDDGHQHHVVVNLLHNRNRLMSYYFCCKGKGKNLPLQDDFPI